MTGLLRNLQRAAAPKPLDPSHIEVGGETLPVVFRRHAQARRLVLRLDSAGTAVLVTVPKGVSRARALDFTERSREWLEEKFSKRGAAIHLTPGSKLALRGVDHEIRHIDSRRGTVTVDAIANVINVPGEPAHLQRRILDFLKAAAKADVTKASERYAALMGVKYRRISVRDQKSRWGSCTSGGDLAYSWRLILTPPYVLDYVAAHEVAHLKHLDHSPKFWRLVLTHCPEATRAKAWLKEHGHDVHRVVV